jgi:predicted AlkP superfamily phosphohydrolase/phosphomutase
MVIGLDCAPPVLVFDKWRKDLPTLDRLMREGVYGPMRSTDPPITVPAWMSMLTSKNPGRLGFYGFRNRKDYSYTAATTANARAVKEPTVWDIIGRKNLKTIALGVPQTYPPRPINGHMVTCFLTPDTTVDYTYPKDLKQEIEEVVGEYIIDCKDFRTENKQWLLDQIFEMTEKRFKLAKHLATTKPWDFFMMVEMGTDRIHHAFWKYIDPEHRKYEKGNPFENSVHDYYVRIDQLLADLLSTVDENETSIMVVSDHGSKRMDGCICINDWLMQNGYLTFKEPVNGVTRFDEKNIDWSKTKAWAWGGYYARLFMNVKGREPEGIIDPADYEKVRTEIAKGVEAIPDDNGQPMKTRALRPEDLYPVEKPAGVAPDLFVYFGDLLWRVTQDVGHDSIYSFETEIGPDDSVHDYDGICIIKSPQHRGGKKLAGLKIVDGAPTMLSLLGVPVPPDMEGKPVVVEQEAVL